MYDVMTNAKVEQADHEFDLELEVNGKSISNLNQHTDLNLLIDLYADLMLNLLISYFCWYYVSYSTWI
jgi:hypothetical protein